MVVVSDWIGILGEFPKVGYSGVGGFRGGGVAVLSGPKILATALP